MLSKGKDTIACADHCGAYYYCALESLKTFEYSKQSDMFSVGATIFEWDTNKPFVYSRVGCCDQDQAVSFYIDTYENGRQLETWDPINKKWIHVIDDHGLVKRESLTPDRTSRSIFSPILESICNVVPAKRITAMEAMTCSDMYYILPKVAKLAAKGMLLFPFLYYNSYETTPINILLSCFDKCYVHTYHIIQYLRNHFVELL
jgi:serine/threonine protein kinase